MPAGNERRDSIISIPKNYHSGICLLYTSYDLTGADIHGRYKDVDITISHAFMPVSQAYIKADEDEIPFFWWKDEGWLTLCDSEVIRYDDVVQWFVAMKQMGFKIK